MKGDRDHTSVSLSVLFMAKFNIGWAKENVDHDHKLTLSSGHVKSADGL